MNQNADHFGNSLPGTPITNPIDADECQYACYTRDECRAYTYTTTKYCYLKSAAGPLAASQGFVTGAKLTGEPRYLTSLLLDGILAPQQYLVLQHNG